MSKFGVMNEIAKFFRGRSGPKSLLLAYARFGKDAVNKFFKQREPSYNFRSRNILRDKMSEAAQKDLLKIIHYALIALHLNQEETEND